MLSYTFFDDFSYIFKRRCQLLLLVVAQRYVVGNLAVITDRIHRIHKLVPGLLVLSLFVENTAFIHNDI